VVFLALNIFSSITLGIENMGITAPVSIRQSSPYRFTIGLWNFGAVDILIIAIHITPFYKHYTAVVPVSP
jgi:hypothetical protein